MCPGPRAIIGRLMSGLALEPHARARALDGPGAALSCGMRYLKHLLDQLFKAPAGGISGRYMGPTIRVPPAGAQTLVTT